MVQHLLDIGSRSDCGGNYGIYRRIEEINLKILKIAKGRKQGVTEPVFKEYYIGIDKSSVRQWRIKTDDKPGGEKMQEMRTKRNDLLASTVIKGLESRNMTGYYAKTKEEALKIALDLIPEGSTVTNGGSMSIQEIGLVEALTKGNYNYINRETYEDKRAAALLAYDADVYLGSANAVSNDGILVNIDGNSNRVSAYAFGPKKLILIVGMNKIADDLDGAMKRARSEAATMNVQRFGLSTPCANTGKCFDCKSPDTICCQFLITRYSRHKDRIHVILVDEELGF